MDTFVIRMTGAPYAFWSKHGCWTLNSAQAARYSYGAAVHTCRQFDGAEISDYF